MAHTFTPRPPNVYEIRVRGEIDTRCLELIRCEDPRICREESDHVTILTAAFVDRAALASGLDALLAAGLTVISVNPR